jgi:hypothetical protein
MRIPRGISQVPVKWEELLREAEADLGPLPPE